MKVLLFGASGMVGQGVLRECLLDADVTEVVAVGRRPLGRSEPLHGVRSKTPLYNAAYVVLAPVLGLWRMLSPDGLTTSERVGKAMLAVAQRGAPSPWIEMADINRLGA